MLNEIYLALLAPLEDYGIIPPDSMMPDISTGLMFSGFLRGRESILASSKPMSTSSLTHRDRPCSHGSTRTSTSRSFGDTSLRCGCRNAPVPTLQNVSPKHCHTCPPSKNYHLALWTGQPIRPPY